MIIVKSNLLKVSPHEPKMVEYPSGIKKLFIKGNSSKVVPQQNLHISTTTFTLHPYKFFDNTEFNVNFTEF